MRKWTTEICRCRPVKDSLIVLTITSVFVLYITFYLKMPFTSKYGKRIGKNEVVGANLSSVIPSIPKMANLKDGIKKLLQELEDKYLQVFKGERRIALVLGKNALICRDLPVYQRALEYHGFHVESLITAQRCVL